MHRILAPFLVLALATLAWPVPAAETEIPEFLLPPHFLAPSWPGEDHFPVPGGAFDELLAPAAHLAGHLEVIGASGQSQGPYDEGRALARTPQGAYYMAGTTYWGQSTNRYEMVLGKWASNGQAAWVRPFNTASYEAAYGVASDADGNAVLAGYRQGANGTYQPVIAKFDGDGKYLWSRVLTTNLSYVAVVSVAVAPDGTIGFAGYGVVPGSWRYAPIAGALSPSGQVAWFQQLGTATSYEVALDTAFDSAGNLYLAGTSYTNGYDSVLTKLSPAGDVLARVVFDAGSYETGAAVAVDGAGNVFLGGSVSGGQVFVARATPDLTQEWLSVVNPGGYGYAYDLAVDSLGSAVLAGQTWTSGGGGSDILVVRFASTGTPLFARAIDRGGYDYAAGVATSPWGTEIVTSGTSYESYQSGSGSDLTLVRSLGFSVLGVPPTVSGLPLPDPGDPLVPVPPLP